LRGSTDANTQTTIYKYNDPLRRLPEKGFPDNGQTTITYNDSPYNPSTPSPSVTTAKEITSSANLTAVAALDGVGHTVRTILTSDPDCASGDRIDTTYDGLGQVYTVSNPYCSTSDPTYGLTTYIRDALGRVTQVTRPDGATALTTYSGRATKVQDEGNGTSRVTRISQVDGLGRVASVCEVTSASQFSSSGTPAACGQDISATGFSTAYGYNALDNLTSVSQNGLNNRSFQYDSLSRLTNAYNPESGATTYSYDPNGNLATKTDARNITITSTYDALNRITQKAYSDGTPSAFFAYEQTSGLGVPLTNPVGRLTEQWTGTSCCATGGAEVFGYDPMGRVVTNEQYTPAMGYAAVNFTYDLAGNTTSFTNGGGETFTYTLNSASRLTSLTSSLDDPNHPRTLLSNITYAPLGTVASTSIGNGLSETYSYSNRGLLTSSVTTSTNPSDGAFATGSVTINGSEKSIQHPGTQSTGNVNINGSEQCVSPPALCDDGTVSVTVGTYTASTSYGTTSTYTTIASALASSLNSSGIVTALASQGNIYLTSVATGTAANYSITSSATSNEGYDPPSFSVSPANGSMTGGTDGTTTYDSGSVSITVKGFVASAAYGSASTTSTLASSLASALNSSNSPVTATANGSVVNLSSKIIGSTADYSLSAASQSSNPSQFSPPSFAMSPSGSTLTGGSGGYNFAIAYGPDGDVISGNDSSNGNWTYSYDDFNRLSGSNRNSGQAVYSYAYDRFGNRWQQNGPNSMQLSFNGANNRTDQFSYDAAGNLVNDGSHQYFYDPESRLIQVDGTLGVCSSATACYVYDAEGRRVEKTTSSGTASYIYDLAGHQVVQYGPTCSPCRDEIYAGGRHLATYTNNTTYFIHSDWLGTERARSNISGSICETITSLPFGDGQSASGSCTDISPVHFTGKERDNETQLDYFGARYYSNALGRFVTPDWSERPVGVPYANFGNPQSLNLYAYVTNKPASLGDPDGHALIHCPPGSNACDMFGNPLRPGQGGYAAGPDGFANGLGAFRPRYTLTALGDRLLRCREGGKGCKALLNSYSDSKDLPTIGWGHWIQKGEDFSDGTTLEGAEDIYHDDRRAAEAVVNRFLEAFLDPHQTDSLISVAFTSKRAAIKLIKQANAGVDLGVQEFIDSLVYGADDQRGLVRRRTLEAGQYKEVDVESPSAPGPISPYPLQP
jgi:RHS repeat-associated protein